jgi:hypothetical protein
MSDKENETIQIVAFSTSSKAFTPNDIINILLEQYTHNIINQSRHAIAFNLNFPNSVKSTKIMMCSIIDLTREYTGITDVNCYLIFVDLQNENSKESLDLIISFSQNYCDLNKKVYTFGVINEKKDAKQIMGEGDIKNIMDSSNMNYEYIQINLIKKEEVADSILYIFMESSKEDSSIRENKIDKNEKQAHSCDVF